MLKRRNWLLDRGADAGTSSDSDSDADESSGGSEPRVSTSGDGSDAGTPDEDAGRDAESSEDEGRREGSSSEQDELGSGDDVDSEEDDDSDAAAMEEGLYGKLKACEMVRNAWLNDQASDLPAKFKNKIFKCRVCMGAVVLNPKSMRDHVASKRHRKNVKRFPYYRDPGEPLLFAEMVTEDTLDRFKADKEPVAGKRPAHGSDSDGEDAAAGGDGQEKPRKKAKRARKGKRQRMEMKAKREAAKKGS